jgi:DNA-binding NarL/FixJ family response regulator
MLHTFFRLQNSRSCINIINMVYVDCDSSLLRTGQMSGKEMVDHLRRIRPDSKVLFLSGYPNDAIVRRRVLDKGLFYIQKTFITERLSQKVREIIYTN